jgi:hypothetical protein
VVISLSGHQPQRPRPTYLPPFESIRRPTGAVQSAYSTDHSMTDRGGGAHHQQQPTPAYAEPSDYQSRGDHRSGYVPSSTDPSDGYAMIPDRPTRYDFDETAVPLPPTIMTDTKTFHLPHRRTRLASSVARVLSAPTKQS